jgi:hypothetical protein
MTTRRDTRDTRDSRGNTSHSGGGRRLTALSSSVYTSPNGETAGHGHSSDHGGDHPLHRDRAREVATGGALAAPEPVGPCSVAPRRGDLGRIADALERILAAIAPDLGRNEPPHQAEIVLTEIDHAHARAAARRAGLVVHEPKRGKKS